MFLHIKAKPNAKQNLIQRLADGTIQVKIKAPAQNGEANIELVKFLSEYFDLPKSKFTVITGHNSPFKKIKVFAEEEFIKKKLEKV